MKPKPIAIDIACNSAEDGMFDYKAEAVHVLGMHFDAIGYVPKFRDDINFIALGGMKFKCFGGRKLHCGNWAWNRYRIDLKDVERLLNWSKFRKWFALTGAYPAHEDICHAYNYGLPIKLHETRHGALR